jgi:hypothetical protein
MLVHDLRGMGLGSGSQFRATVAFERLGAHCAVVVSLPWNNEDVRDVILCTPCPVRLPVVKRPGGVLGARVGT